MRTTLVRMHHFGAAALRRLSGKASVKTCALVRELVVAPIIPRVTAVCQERIFAVERGLPKLYNNGLDRKKRQKGSRPVEILI